VFSRSAEPFLPGSPKARVGTIIHGFLEEVGQGNIDPTDSENFRKAWEERIESEEEKMAASRLEERFIPFADSVPLLEVLYFQCRDRAEELADLKESSTGGGTARNEEWVETSEGDVGGYIDRVIEGDLGVILQDYKTGSLFSTSEEEGRSLKGGYQDQIKLYAALYREKYSEWPTELQLVKLDGTAAKLNYSQDEARSLLQEAQNLHDRVNQAVERVKESKDDLSCLADPSQETCRFCQYRPACPSYLMTREEADEDGWPDDVAGVVVRAERDKGGRLVLRVDDTIPGKGGVSCRGIEMNMIFGFEDGVEEEKAVGIFGLYEQSEGVFRATNWTAVYKVDETLKRK
jgi:RecB family exonuclease